MQMRNSGEVDVRSAEEVVIYAVRPRLHRVVALINGKGGTGKTTVTSNVGYTLATALHAAGSARRVLLIELDDQGDLGLDLGHGRTERDDSGKSIVAAVLGVGELKVVRDVRPNLDVVCGGAELLTVGALLKGMDHRQKRVARLRFAQAVAEIAPEYDLILVDCPPKERDLQALGITVARWVLIPGVFDKASRYGLEGVSAVFEEVDDLNPDKEVLGVLLFGFERKEERYSAKTEATYEVGQRKRVRALMEGLLEKIEVSAPVLDSVVSWCRVVAEEGREAGLTAAELADMSKDPEWAKKQRNLDRPAVSPDTAESLAADYEELTNEILSLICKHELEYEEQGA